LGIGDHLRRTRLAHGFQTFDDGRQFHAVVSGVRFRSHQLPSMVVVAQDAGPTPWTGIADASPICNQLNVFQAGAPLLVTIYEISISSRSKKASTMSRIPGASWT
jgi:hypothetical protein